MGVSANDKSAMLPASRDDGMCACEGCEKPKARKHPLCHGHAKRYQKNGVIGGSLRKRGSLGLPRYGPNGGECAIEGCRRKAESLGLCLGHYQGVRYGLIVEDGKIVSRQVTSDGLKYGDPWIKWSNRFCGYLSGKCRQAEKDKWDKWAVLKFGNMRRPRYQSRRPNPRPGACNATWDTKAHAMRGQLGNQVLICRQEKWDRWSTKKAILIYGR